MQFSMQIISFFTLLILIPLNALPVFCFRKHFGEAMPFTMMLVPLVMETMQFVTGTFYSGTILLLVSAISGLILLLRKVKESEFRRLFFSAGFSAFLVIFIFVSAWDFQRHFTDFDEFWHWGMMIKESLRLDRFYCVPQSRMVIHKDYPPFLCMLEVFFSILGGYSEGLVSASVLLAVLLSPNRNKFWQIKRGIAENKVMSFSSDCSGGASYCIMANDCKKSSRPPITVPAAKQNEQQNCCRHAIMITIQVEKFNPTQEFYDQCINSLQFHQLECPCCHHKDCMTVHGYYTRMIRISDDLVLELRVLRLKCSECNTTHAVLLSSIVPYSQIPAADQIEVIERHEQGESAGTIMEAVQSVDESSVKHILWKYVHFWKVRLQCERIALSEKAVLIRECFAHYSLQFMQIRFTPNGLFQGTT